MLRGMNWHYAGGSSGSQKKEVDNDQKRLSAAQSPDFFAACAFRDSNQLRISPHALNHLDFEIHHNYL